MRGLGPTGVFGSKSYASRDWLSNYGVLKIEGFGGRPPVGGRPVPPKSGPGWNSLSQDEVDVTSVNSFKSRLEKRRSRQMDFFKDL